MTAYVGIDGKARGIKSAYIGVDGVAREVKKAYVGVNGVAQLWWAADAGGGPIVLEVEKRTFNTYAGETTYTGESFILLDIYPKTNGTVSVTYGGLTKTVTDTSGAEEPNAQQVFFGTFNGVTDSVETPASGELMISGDCYAFACGYFAVTSKSSNVCGCIVSVVDWGFAETAQIIADYAFSGCTGLTSIDIPDGVTSIGVRAFHDCTGLTSIDIPDGVTSIAIYAFGSCTSLTSIDIPDGVTDIPNGMLSGCTSLTDVDIPDGVTSIGNYAFSECASLLDITVPASVSQIGNHAFYKQDQTVFRTVTMLSKTPPTLGSSDIGNMFGPISKELYKIVVPKGCLSAYEAADIWENLAGDGVFVEAS